MLGMPLLPRYHTPLRKNLVRHRRVILYGSALPSFIAAVAMPAIGHAGVHTAQHPLPVQIQRSAQTTAPHIGSAMAVLATLQDAEVLPPEGTRDANSIIRFVIQFQAVFTKSADPAVHAFARQAMASQAEPQPAEGIARLRATGWTADALERLSDEEGRRSPEDLQELAQGFAVFNVSVGNFHTLMQLVREARQAFQTRGLEFRQVFASRRKEMPGTG